MWLRFRLFSRLSSSKCMDMVVEVVGFLPLLAGGAAENLEAQGGCCGEREKLS